MKKYSTAIFLTFFLFSLSYLQSQIITWGDRDNQATMAKQFVEVSLGLASTDFTYFNSKGSNEVFFIPGNKNFLSLNYSIRLVGTLFARTGFDLMSFATSSIDESNRNSYEWDTSYIGLGTGLDWMFLSFNKLSLRAQSKIGFANIISGTQKINSEVFDITNNPEFKDAFFNGEHLYFSYGIALNFILSENITIGINASQLTYTNVGLINFPKPGIESLRQKAQNFGFTIIFPFLK